MSAVGLVSMPCCRRSSRASVEALALPGLSELRAALRGRALREATLYTVLLVIDGKSYQPRARSVFAAFEQWIATLVEMMSSHAVVVRPAIVAKSKTAGEA